MPALQINTTSQLLQGREHKMTHPVGTLTEMQQQMLDWIRAYIRERGLPPTIREITAGLHISSTSVTAYHLDKLESKRAIRRERFISSGIHLVCLE